jgi:hypothetical protein
MIRRKMIQRLERLEKRLAAERQLFQITIEFVDPAGTVTSTLLLGQGLATSNKVSRSANGSGVKGRRRAIW